MRPILLVVHVLSAPWTTVTFAMSAAYAQFATRRRGAEEVAAIFSPARTWRLVVLSTSLPLLGSPCSQ